MLFVCGGAVDDAPIVVVDSTVVVFVVDVVDVVDGVVVVVVVVVDSTACVLVVAFCYE